jgi:DNA polymerase-1
MERHGILIDKEHFSRIRTQIESRLKEIEKTVTDLVGVTINLNSPKQLSGLLFDTLGLKTKGKRKESGAFTTNAETLELLKDSHPVIPLILEQRELQKILSCPHDEAPNGVTPTPDSLTHHYRIHRGGCACAREHHARVVSNCVTADRLRTR